MCILYGTVILKYYLGLYKLPGKTHMLGRFWEINEICMAT
jgi:hypothetical protein